MNTARIKYTLQKSELSTIVGKYIALIIANGTSDISALSAAMSGGRSVIEDADARFAIAAIADEIATQLAVNHNRVDFFGLLDFELAIDKSLPSMDAPLGEENAIYIAIHPSDSLRAEAAKIIPVKTMADERTVYIDKVEDISTHKRMFIGTGNAVITGMNLSATGEGESLRILKDDGSVATTVTVTGEEGYGERIYCHLAQAVESGEYTLELVTNGYSTPGGESHRYTKSVAVATA